MITTTLQALLGETSERMISQQEQFPLFVVREESIVFWVGQGKPRRRLLEHLGVEGQWPSQIGTLILNNLPQSMSWTVELWTILDCEPYHQTDVPLDEETAKLELVAHYRPCLNVSGNPNPTPLPDTYRASLSKTSPRYNIKTLLGLNN